MSYCVNTRDTEFTETDYTTDTVLGDLLAYLLTYPTKQSLPNCHFPSGFPTKTMYTTVMVIAQNTGHHVI